MFFFFSSRRRHTRCALVTGVQTCALPISRLAARRTPIEETEKLVEAFAEAQPKQALNAKLTALFGRTLEVINRDRASIIAGIKRFSVRQRELAERIREARATVEQNAGAAAANDRSEEHTSELQSLMRISYAAF